jgi:hypothetical protein
MLTLFLVQKNPNMGMHKIMSNNMINIGEIQKRSQGSARVNNFSNRGSPVASPMSETRVKQIYDPSQMIKQLNVKIMKHKLQKPKLDIGSLDNVQVEDISNKSVSYAHNSHISQRKQSHHSDMLRLANKHGPNLSMIRIKKNLQRYENVGRKLSEPEISPRQNTESETIQSNLRRRRKIKPSQLDVNLSKEMG